MRVLNFHRVEKPTGLEITRLSPGRFARVLDEVESLRTCDRWEKGAHPCVPMIAPHFVGLEGILITFDDGFASICDYALPRLRERGWNAIVFLIAEAVGRTDDWDVRILGRRRPMINWDQAREWSNAGFTFGSHTRSHRDLTALSRSRLRTELVNSKAKIEDELRQEVRYLSYPFGRHNEHVREAAREAGYSAAFATSGGPGDRFAIPRVNVHALMTSFELRRLLTTDGPPSWRSRLFSSLSAGSAAVGNWRGAYTEPATDIGRRPALPSTD